MKMTVRMMVTIAMEKIEIVTLYTEGEQPHGTCRHMVYKEAVQYQLLS